MKRITTRPDHLKLSYLNTNSVDLITLAVISKNFTKHDFLCNMSVIKSVIENDVSNENTK